MILLYVIYASQASEPHIPDIPGSQNFKGEIYHSIDFNSYCASVAQERRKVGCRDGEASNWRSKTAKTLAIGANYSTNKGLYV